MMLRNTHFWAKSYSKIYEIWGYGGRGCTGGWHSQDEILIGGDGKGEMMSQWSEGWP